MDTQDMNGIHGYGAGIYSSGTLEIIRSKIENNYAHGGYGTPSGNGYGGGIYAETGSSLYLKDTTITRNRARGGGITRPPGDGKGGGIYLEPGVSTQIIGSTFHANTALGGIGGTIGVSEGGGLYVAGDATDEVLVRLSTFSANRLYYPYSSGAGIYGRAALTLDSCTFAENVSDGIGPGIFVPSATPTNGPNVRNTILGGRPGSTGLPNTHDSTCLRGRINSKGFIFSEADDFYAHIDTTAPGNTDEGNIIGAVGSILPFADNGGPTWTHALKPTSDAINAGTNIFLDGSISTRDQRGLARVAKSVRSGLDEIQADIGAFELHASTSNVASFDLYE
jgi:hypothetical protein